MGRGTTSRVSHLVGRPDEKTVVILMIFKLCNPRIVIFSKKVNKSEDRNGRNFNKHPNRPENQLPNQKTLLAARLAQEQLVQAKHISTFA